MAGLFISVRKIIDIVAIVVVAGYLSSLHNTENDPKNMEVMMICLIFVLLPWRGKNTSDERLHE